MKIIFNHPPALDAERKHSKNPFVDFDPSNEDHYPLENEVGVYILGIKAKVDHELKFIPLVVGEGKLRNRLYNDHYLSKYVTPLINLAEGKTKKIKEKKEIWNFSKSNYKKEEVKKIYADMHTYDKLPRNGRTEKPFLSVIADLKNLLYFQNKNFFNCRFSKFNDSHVDMRSDESVLYLIELLNDKKYVKRHLEIQKNIFELVLTLKNLSNNFYFVYTSQEVFSTTSNKHFIEVGVKQELEKLGIYTTADSNRKGEKSDILEFEMDLNKNKIKEILIKL